MDARFGTTQESMTAFEPELIEQTLAQSDEERHHTAQLSRATLRPPGIAPGFEMIRALGRGAYGAVWLAKERKTGRFAAIKFFSRRGQDWALLGREVEKLAALDSSHYIVGLIDVGWDADPPYYAMEYLPNGSLAAYLASGPLPVAEAVDIAGVVARGLVHAHGGGILHCDLKPANVLLDQDFQPRLCDFGQARMTEEDRPALGTLFYMAPEQADLKALPDARWDVYGLGALLYQMLTGRAPHQSPEAEQLLDQCETLPERLAVYRDYIRGQGAPTDLMQVTGVDRGLAEIVERCLAPNPGERYRNPQLVVEALRAREQQRSRRPLVALGLVGPLLLLSAMIPFFLTTMRNAEQAAKETLVERALESDALASRLLARSLTQELQDRTVELEQMAGHERLVAAVEQAQAAGWADRSAIEEVLTRWKGMADERRTRLQLTRDTSWFLNDADGFQRWREPYKASTHDRNFSFKDYFHGRGEQYDESVQGTNPPPDDLKIVQESHISTVFRSDATGYYMVAITTPIRNAEGEVIAQLGRTQHLWELLEDYKQSGNSASLLVADDQENVSGEESTPNRAPAKAARSGEIVQQLVLVDRRNWQLVDHPWLTREQVVKFDDEMLSRLRIAQPLTERLESELRKIDSGEQDAAVQIANYRDPIGQEFADAREYAGIWLASAYPVAATDWVAIVQENRDSAVASAEKMRSQLFIYAGAALAVGGGLIVTFWYFVTQALAQRVRRDRTRAVGNRRLDTEISTS